MTYHFSLSLSLYLLLFTYFPSNSQSNQFCKTDIGIGEVGCGILSPPSSTTKLLIKGGTVVNAHHQEFADVYVEDGIIVAVEPNLRELCYVRFFAELAESNAKWNKVGDDVKVIDATGKYVMPGGIDPHTHLAMEALNTESVDDFFSGQAAALAGGTTMHIDFVIPVNGSLTAGLEVYEEKAKKSCMDYGFHMVITKFDDIVSRDMEIMVKEKGINSFKFFLAYKGVLMVNDELLLEGLKRCKSLGALAMVHAENGDAVFEGQKRMIQLGITGPEGHALSRPPLLEGEATARAIRLAGFVNTPLYVVHVMSIDAMEEIARARKSGLLYLISSFLFYYWLSSTIYEFGNKDDVPFKAFIVTTRLLYVLLAVVPGSVANYFPKCVALLSSLLPSLAFIKTSRNLSYGTLNRVVKCTSTTRFYSRHIGQRVVGEPVVSGLVLDDSRLWDSDFTTASKYVMSPPIRASGHGKALQGALSNGVLQLVGTDHCVFNSTQKAFGIDDFRKIPNGVNGIEERMHLVWDTMVESGQISITDYVRVTSTEWIFNMYPRKGAIIPGSDADIIILNPHSTFEINARSHHSRTDTNVYEGRRGKGKVEVTIAGGRVVWENNELKVVPGSGKYIKMAPFSYLFSGLDRADASYLSSLNAPVNRFKSTT
ncbi:hypothetical protein SADUNF_Sadunf16G0157600 [Salix dunnii]|uniref:dihydropyrimidinase n=1 Tax=Salix dunnii TaxID=1413687 RepID=A0A835JBE2_9ROSI|nr:hypothetical protein SADUNF_Sadunf16G0157600 [Salix dunnii]